MKKTQKTDPFWCGRQVVPSLSPRSPHFVAISVEFIPCVYVKLVKNVIATHPRMGNDSHQKYMYTVGTIEIIYLFTYLLPYLYLRHCAAVYGTIRWPVLLMSGRRTCRFVATVTLFGLLFHGELRPPMSTILSTVK